MHSDSIRRQSKQIFQNVEILLNEYPDEKYNEVVGGFKVWKHFYHLIHSMDKNFIDPSCFNEPEFHIPNLDVIFMESEKSLGKNNIIEYYQTVKVKINKYLNELNDNELDKVIKFRDIELTKLELILAQFRHIFYHVGYLHCCIKTAKGETPEYIGLYKVKIQ